MDQKTPQWLLDTQNKSWEPEILISGITLTFLFLMPDHIYNFFGMLVQDHGVRDVIAGTLFKISMIWLTGLKIILLIHLILRGLWTGFIGLSFVFPDGVKTENLPKEQQGKTFEKPESYVIKIEKMCSLLFSFIFSSIFLVLGILVLFIPIAMLYFTPLDLEVIRKITIFGILPGVMVPVIIMSILLATKLKDSRFQQKLEMLSLSPILVIYLTNLGRVKTILMFALYFLAILGLCWGDISSFSFDNNEDTTRSTRQGIVHINRDHIEESRDQRRRIERATISQFRVTNGSLGLFIAFYRQDSYTAKRISENAEILKKFGLSNEGNELWVQNLYKVKIDGVTSGEMQWYFTEHASTGQKGLKTIIPLNDLEPGIHELALQKLVWSVSKKELEEFKEWQIMPFELQPSDKLSKNSRLLQPDGIKDEKKSNNPDKDT